MWVVLGYEEGTTITDVARSRRSNTNDDEQQAGNAGVVSQSLDDEGGELLKTFVSAAATAQGTW